MKRSVLKKLFCVFCCSLLICAATFNTCVAFNTPNNEEHDSLYVELSAAEVTLSISSQGIASCICNVDVRHPGFTIEIQMDLEQKQPSGWETIKSWSGTGPSRRYSLSEMYAVNSGYDYRLCTTVTVYNTTDYTIIDNDNFYSYVFHY